MCVCDTRNRDDIARCRLWIKSEGAVCVLLRIAYLQGSLDGGLVEAVARPLIRRGTEG